MRYENDDVARFTLVLNGLEDAVARLASAEIGETRLALITADYLADLLFARRIESLVSLSERAPLWGGGQKFDAKARGLLRQGFNRRVALAARSYDARFTFGLGDPILEPGDAEVLRVAHTYRNDVYHGDRHNPSTLPVVAAAALHAVARAWVASLPANVAGSHGSQGPLMTRLNNRGYAAPHWAGRGVLSLHAGAVAVAAWLKVAVPVDLSAQRAALIADIDRRVEWAKSMIEWLSGHEGPGPEEIEPALQWNDFWRQHGPDPLLVELDTKRRNAWDHVLDASSDDLAESDRAEIQVHEDLYLARLRELQVSFTPAVTLDGLPGIAQRGRRLRSAGDTGSLFAGYRTLDMDLRVFEETLAGVAVSWDEYVQSEIDRRRGK